LAIGRQAPGAGKLLSGGSTVKLPSAGTRAFCRTLLEHRFLVAAGFGAAIGAMLRPLLALRADDPILRYVALEASFLYRIFICSWWLFLSTTPFILLSIGFSLIYVHCYGERAGAVAGPLPPFPAPERRNELFLILGEVHQATLPEPAPTPRWLKLPEKGLYTGIAAIGSTGSGKTQALILPALRQLFAYQALNPERKLSGVVLEVKGDVCRSLAQILEEYGRGEDYIEVSLDSNIRYNPLNNDLDPYAQAFSLASIITSIWGRGKEPFWQQSYTDLVRYVILLHRIRYGYVTLVDIFRTVISSGRLEELLIETGGRLNPAEFIAISPANYVAHRRLLAPFHFRANADANEYVAERSEELSRALETETSIPYKLYRPKFGGAEESARFDSVNYWYWEHWKFFRNEVKTSIVQGIAVFLSLFETDPNVRRVFCPPQELYETKIDVFDPGAVVLEPFDQLIETGKVIGLNFPVSLNPALAKTIGTMMKIDYQRAVQLRIPKMEKEPDRHFRPTVFICDEYQNFATVGGDSPVGDERFFSISRQPKCIPIVATQSVSSLREALANQGFKTLLQGFRTKIFLTTSDPDTARFASEICGKTDKTKISYTVSESSTNAHVGWLSGRTSSSRGSVSASKQYHRSREPVFEERVFFELGNAQAVVVAFDGEQPLPATYCYLKPDFLPVERSWFQQTSSR
jgi:hypothetical protein